VASLKVYNAQGGEVGTYDIEPSDLAGRINKQLLHDVVVMYQANLRQGTHRTRSRGETSYSTRKLYRQKGTGNARAGARSSGTRRGGADLLAIRPRDYSYRLPRKAVRLATRMALAGKLKDDEVTLIESFGLEQPSTKAAAQIIAAVGCGDSSVLVVTQGYDPLVYKSVRNLAYADALPDTDINALSLLQVDRVLMVKEALEAIKERAAGGKAAVGA